MVFTADRRRVALAGALVALVAVAVGGTVAWWGASLAVALAAGVLVGLFALVVVPLALIAREVGSTADDPLALERRIGAAAGRSTTELDALAEWDERRGRLEEPADRD
ncbi:hypothetical protein [Halomarina rubra]|uniref:Uncharacterized protein n=1 Tax=Halomarina rubra TaxID=2071873 RepID=A0ABD6AZJ6_9EURY|nr:hypothetical protein [Halomarina rubra]